MTDFQVGDRVIVFDDPEDTAIVTGHSNLQDNQGNQLVELDNKDCISPQYLTKTDN